MPSTCQSERRWFSWIRRLSGDITALLTRARLQLTICAPGKLLREKEGSKAGSEQPRASRETKNWLLSERAYRRVAPRLAAHG